MSSGVGLDSGRNRGGMRKSGVKLTCRVSPNSNSYAHTAVFTQSV